MISAHFSVAFKSMTLIPTLEVTYEVVHGNVLARARNAHDILDDFFEGVLLALIVSVGARSFGLFEKVENIY